MGKMGSKEGEGGEERRQCLEAQGRKRMSEGKGEREGLEVRRECQKA